MKYEENFPWGVDKDMTYVPTAEWKKIQARIAQLEAALQSLLPGLVLDLRYADADDDRDAMQSRIDTVMDCFTPQPTGDYTDSIDVPESFAAETEGK